MPQQIKHKWTPPNWSIAHWSVRDPMGQPSETMNHRYGDLGENIRQIVSPPEGSSHQNTQMSQQK